MLTRCLLVLVALASVAGVLGPATPAAAAGDANLLTFGDAPFAGSTSGMALSSPLVAMASTGTGSGYWLVARDGGIFSFGDAGFHGSTGDIRLNQPIVGMAGTSSGNGYWMVAADGGIFSFGDAPFHGSAAGHRLGKPVVAMAATPDGGGYWLLAGDGAVHAFGNAPHLGNAPGRVAVTGIAGSPSGQGYRLLDEDGGIFAFGDAVFAGSGAGAMAPGAVALDLAATPSGLGYWIATGAKPLAQGSSGSPVVLLQSRLDALGYWVPVDGRFGATTTQALYALQKAAGIPRTGQFDAATARALDGGVLPTPRSTTGYVAEIDKRRQLLMLVSNGRLVRVFNTSTGNGKRYRSGSGTAIAHTPEGAFTVYRQINGMRVSELGELYRPKYFTGGYAIHGSPSIPPYPASHGCVRLSNAAISYLWDHGGLPLGTPVLVYS